MKGLKTLQADRPNISFVFEELLHVMRVPILGRHERMADRQREVKLVKTLMTGALLNPIDIEAWLPTVEELFDGVESTHIDRPNRTHESQQPYWFVVDAVLALLARVRPSVRTRCVPAIVAACLAKSRPSMRLGEEEPLDNDGRSLSGPGSARRAIISVQLGALQCLADVDAAAIAPHVRALALHLARGSRAVGPVRIGCMELLSRVGWTRRITNECLPAVISRLDDAAEEEAVVAVAMGIVEGIKPSSVLPHVQRLLLATEARASGLEQELSIDGLTIGPQTIPRASPWRRVWALLHRLNDVQPSQFAANVPALLAMIDGTSSGGALVEIGYHPGVDCDRTGQNPIVGDRYKLVGANYDVCEAEYLKMPDNERAKYTCIPPPMRDERVVLLEREATLQRSALANLIEQMEVSVLAPNETSLIALQGSAHAEARQVAADCLQALYAPPVALNDSREAVDVVDGGGHGGPLYLATLAAFERHTASGISLMHQLSSQLGGVVLTTTDAAEAAPPKLERQQSRFECPTCRVVLQARLVRHVSETMVRCECGAVFAVVR